MNTISTQSEPGKSNPININSSDTTKTKSSSKDSIKWVTNQTDSIDLIMFWNYAITPILKKDKRTVLSTIHFPLQGDWTYMIKLNKQPESATSHDFLINYDRIFNPYFIEQLSLQTFKNIEVSIHRDTVYYSFSVGKKEEGTESSVLFHYKKYNGKYQLFNIQGAGGDFYGIK